MFDVAPLVEVKLLSLKLNVEQSIVLATKPHPTRLAFMWCKFEGRGTAFVDALCNRKSSFGALVFEERTGLSDDNLEHLLQVVMTDHLRIPLLNDKDLALLPFSALVNSLNYDIYSSLLSEADWQSLNIVGGDCLGGKRLGRFSAPCTVAMATFRNEEEGFSHRV